MGIREGSAEPGLRSRERTGGVDQHCLLRDCERKEGETNKRRKILWSSLKEQVEVCEGCLVISDLGNVNPEMTNMLFLGE